MVKTTTKDRKTRSAENVKAVRVHEGMSQEQFAGTIGVATNTISRIETGSVSLSADVALRINKKFHVSMDYLFGLSRYEEGEPPCTKTCADLINALSFIDIQEATIKNLDGKLEAIRKVIEGKKIIKLKRPEFST